MSLITYVNVVLITICNCRRHVGLTIYFFLLQFIISAGEIFLFHHGKIPSSSILGRREASFQFLLETIGRTIVDVKRFVAAIIVFSDAGQYTFPSLA